MNEDKKTKPINSGTPEEPDPTFAVTSQGVLRTEPAATFVAAPDGVLRATIPAEKMPAAIQEWNQPPVAEGKVGETITLAPGQLEPTERARELAAVENARWSQVDTERMTGAVPHLAEGGLQDHPVEMVNGQVVACPFFDPGDGLWGGVCLGDVVVYYPPGAVQYLPATVLELRPDANDGAVARLVYFGGPSGMGVALVPHQSARPPSGACWAHRTEEFTITGRIAAELQLGRGGSAYEQAKIAAAARAQAEADQRLYLPPELAPEEAPTALEMHIVTCEDCQEDVSRDVIILCDAGLAIRLAEEN